MNKQFTQVPTRINKENVVNFCDLLKLQAKKNPHAIAAIFEENSLTCEELVYRSRRWASFLIANGVKPESIIALSLHNSLDLLVGFLGILLSGGAYLPVDPNYPIGRVESLIKDANPAIFITEKSLRNNLSHLPCTVFQIDQPLPMELPDRDQVIHPNSLAYVVYTSGTTGQPKGIMVEHRALTHAVLAYQELHPNRLISLVAGSISFDASLLVISHTLASGGTVCFPKSSTVVDLEQTISLIEKHKINNTLCVPSFYSMLLNKSRKLPSLLSIELGGESLPSQIPSIHSEIAPNADLYNVYGPSEYAVGATFAKIYDPLTKKIDRITIGKPFSNTQVFILDEDLQQVSTGVKGEIFIGGEGLARGYLNNEALTKEKFIWSSLTNQESIRLYKTGDFGCFLPDGNIEFLGRRDYQIKIRGFRIEPGEIEYWICQHPEISNAVVIVQEEADGRKHLVAFFSTSSEINPDVIRLYLNNLLPSHMIPATFVRLDQFPLLSNGKIDRKALQELSSLKIEKHSVQQPQSRLEQTLMDIWKTILQRKAIGIHDNFFDIGGDSLGVAIMQTSIQSALSCEVSIVDLFRFPTIFQLAQHFRGQENETEPNQRLLSKHQSNAEKRKAAFQRLKEQHMS